MNFSGTTNTKQIKVTKMQLTNFPKIQTWESKCLRCCHVENEGKDADGSLERQECIWSAHLKWQCLASIANIITCSPWSLIFNLLWSQSITNLPWDLPIEVKGVSHCVRDNFDTGWLETAVQNFSLPPLAMKVITQSLSMCWWRHNSVV